MDGTPLSDEVKNMVLEEMLDAEQRQASFGDEGEADPINMQGFYQHVDDGELGQLRYTEGSPV
jgi:hypothetical protein